MTYSKQQLEIAETGEWKVNLLQGEVGAECEEDGDALWASDHALDHVEILSCASCNMENEGTGV